ncbi:MAG: hypothetical protein Q7K57_29075 [Burkholderiaceae bacterium]|nr:hypothetical protein [Burkholderiaceae bacterium]
MADMERFLETQTVEGEISLVIDYQPGKALALDVLQGAMKLIESLDALDRALLSSVDSALEPVSILNDIQHSSLKMMLARALRHVPDEHLGSLDWKKWVGNLLVQAKYKLLQNLDADAPQIRHTLSELESAYKDAPVQLIGYSPPSVADVQGALEGVSKARASFPGQVVTIQTELGDVRLSEVYAPTDVVEVGAPDSTVVNGGVEFFKIKSVDMLGHSQWTVLRNGRMAKVDMLHQSWLQAYQERRLVLLPGDSLECRYEERIIYDASHNELERHLSIIEVMRIITPPVQTSLA